MKCIRIVFVNNDFEEFYGDNLKVVGCISNKTFDIVDTTKQEGDDKNVIVSFKGEQVSYVIHDVSKLVKTYK